MTTSCFHGWGFPGSIFGDGKGFDRGYFGHGRAAIVAPKVVAHSFGLHLVPNDVWKQCRELVILSGFIRLKERVKLRAMRQKLRQDPIALLRAFYQEAGYNGEAPWLNKEINTSLLDADLVKMEEVLDMEPLRLIDSIEIYHARDDAIVRDELALELKKALPQACMLEMGGNHMSTLTTWIKKQALQEPSPESVQATLAMPRSKKR